MPLTKILSMSINNQINDVGLIFQPIDIYSFSTKQFNMKKFLLTFACAALAVTGVFAAERTVTWDLTSVSDTEESISTFPYVINGDGVSITLTSSTYPFLLGPEGLGESMVPSAHNEYAFTINADGNKITKIEFITTDDFTSFTVGGRELYCDNIQYNGEWRLGCTWERPSDFTSNEIETLGVFDDSKGWGNEWITNIIVLIITFEDSNSSVEYANLSVTNAEVTTSIADKSFDPAANIINPKNVELTWTSSIPEVATVTPEGIELKNEGTTVLTATVASEGYAPESVSYSLTLVNEALTIAQMNEMAPKAGDSVRIAGNLVFYVAGVANGKYATLESKEDENGEIIEEMVTRYNAYIFAEDKNGNPIVFYKDGATTNITSYKTDDIIEGNWTAKNASSSNLNCWTGVPTPTSRAMDWISIKKVNNLEGLTENKIVVLKNVTLSDKVPTIAGEFVGVLADGSQVKLYNLLNPVSVTNRGIYNITGALGKNEKNEPVFYPLTYELAEELAPLFPDQLEITPDIEGVTITQMCDENEGQLMVYISGAVASNTLTVNFATPEGWDGYLLSVMEGGISQGPLLRTGIATDPEAWVPIANLTEGTDLKEGNSMTFTLDENGSQVIGGGYLYKGKDAYTGIMISVICAVKDTTSGVAAIEAAEEGAVYFNLQGVEVKNPAAGIYVKVANGKANKVILK